MTWIDLQPASAFTPPPSGIPFLRLGFRVFFVLAAAGSILSLLAWVPVISPAHSLIGIQLSALTWTAAFGIYIVQYGPSIINPISRMVSGSPARSFQTIRAGVPRLRG